MPITPAAVADKIVADGGSAASYELDVADEAQWKACVAAVTDLQGSISILVGNAAITTTRCARPGPRPVR
jgi:NAD(P)-dependent dehydrogenase (short-subunit alcohol dehydrogenase family)